MVVSQYQYVYKYAFSAEDPDFMHFYKETELYEKLHDPQLLGTRQGRTRIDWIVLHKT